MLAVVDGEVAALEGEGEAAEAGPAFQEGHVESGVGEAERRRHPGEATADDDADGARALVAHVCPSRRVVAVCRFLTLQIVAVSDAPGHRRVAPGPEPRSRIRLAPWR
ncbi:hypothetical protein GCM10010328_31850 [Streptomyces rubiginosohelvolus]|uniref:Uncharacterized protein n=1 Tax=Streptomyces rubiginosohelvolus TaxID=67362 RepID=A0ABQ3BTJ0_9ACTN|nr:hypothetical protein GCM10010328_31850 [Streptomyces pluricolorescens]